MHDTYIKRDFVAKCMKLYRQVNFYAYMAGSLGYSYWFAIVGIGQKFLKLSNKTHTNSSIPGFENLQVSICRLTKKC